jgi:hypothetical protein
MLSTKTSRQLLRKKRDSSSKLHKLCKNTKMPTYSRRRTSRPSRLTTLVNGLSTTDQLLLPNGRLPTKLQPNTDRISKTRQLDSLTEPTKELMHSRKSPRWKSRKQMSMPINNSTRLSSTDKLPKMLLLVKLMHF